MSGAPPPDDQVRIREFGKAVSERLEDFTADCHKLRAKYPDLHILVYGLIPATKEVVMYHLGHKDLLISVNQRCAMEIFEGRYIGGKADPT